MAKKYEINITQINEDGTREAFKVPNELIGEGFVATALTEYEKDGREGVHAVVSLNDVSLVMIATALSSNKYLRQAAHLACLGGAADKLLGTIDDMLAEEEDAAD